MPVLLSLQRCPSAKSNNKIKSGTYHGKSSCNITNTKQTTTHHFVFLYFNIFWVAWIWCNFLFYLFFPFSLPTINKTESIDGKEFHAYYVEEEACKLSVGRTQANWWQTHHSWPKTLGTEDTAVTGTGTCSTKIQKIPTTITGKISGHYWLGILIHIE